MGLLKTPTSKAVLASRQRRSAESGLDNLLVRTGAADRTFVDKALNDKPELVAVVARMLRDGDIERALARQEAKSVVEKLGNALPQKSKKLKGLPPRVWKSLFHNLLGLGSSDSFEPDGAEVMTDSQRMNLCLFALNCTPDAEVPTKHAGAGYEGPLVSVLKAVSDEQGKRLQGLTHQNFRTWGWVKLVAEDPTKVSIQGSASDPPLMVQLPYPSAFMQQLTITIENNCFLSQAKLCDHQKGFNQLVLPLLTMQHPGHTYHQDIVSLERPDAAAAFEGISTSPARSESSLSGPSPSRPSEPCPEMPMVTPPPKRRRIT